MSSVVWSSVVDEQCGGFQRLTRKAVQSSDVKSRGPSKRYMPIIQFSARKIPAQEELGSSRGKECKARTVAGRGGRESPVVCDPGSELRLGGREKKKGEDNKWNGEKKKKKFGVYVAGGKTCMLPYKAAPSVFL